MWLEVRIPMVDGLPTLTVESVTFAMKEWDRGRTRGFQPAKQYWLYSGERKYPSKAIAGIAGEFVDGFTRGPNYLHGGKHIKKILSKNERQQKYLEKKS